MIDTIHLLVENRGFKNLKSISNKIKKIDGETGEILSTEGYFKNLAIKIYSDNISIWGSLSKYFKGSNLFTLKRKDVQFAIAQLENELGMSLKFARVTRLDLADNLKMQNPPIHYFKYFGHSNYYKISSFVNKSQLLYENKSKSKSFYDKRKQMKKDKKFLLMPKYKDAQNILRYEFQLKKNVIKQFGGKVTAQMLYDKSFYERLIGLWEKEFYKIDKIPKRDFYVEGISTPSELVKFLTLMGLNSYGADKLLESISNQKIEFKNKQLPKLKKKINDLSKEDIWVDYNNKDIEELNNKVRMCASMNRALI